MELAFAGLHQLCAPMLDRLGRLPGPQRDALGTAFGLSVGGAAGSLPGRAGGARACWPRSPRTSRWSASSTTRSGSIEPPRRRWRSSRAVSWPSGRVGVRGARARRAATSWLGLPELVVEGLGDDDARALLDSAIHGPAGRARARPDRRRDARQPAGAARAAARVDPGGAGGRVRASRRAAVDEPHRAELPSAGRSRCPTRRQRLLLVAAAEPVGDVTLLWRAAERLGIAAERRRAGRSGGADRARRPGRVSAIRWCARRPTARRPPTERRQVHGALAEATDPELDPDRRAWHRAQAAIGPDEEVAEPSWSARPAGRRRAAASRRRPRFWTRAHRADARSGTPRRSARWPPRRRSSTPARPTRRSSCWRRPSSGPLDELQRARLERLRAADRVRPSGAAATLPPLLLEAARRLEPLDAGLARETYLEALGAAIFAGRLGSGRGVAGGGRGRPRGAARRRRRRRPIDLLLDGLATRFTERLRGGRAAAEASAGRIVARPMVATGDALRWLWLACRVAPDLWDDEAWHELATRRSGSLAMPAR